MGKTQSKSQIGLYRKRDCPEGECFVVNAHFNPLAVSDYEETSTSPPQSEKEADSETMLSLSSCASTTDLPSSKVGFANDSYPLKVLLPCDGSESSDCIKKALSKSDLDTCEASDVDVKQRIQDFGYDVSVETAEVDSEKQEFLFTLYDLDGHGKITKDDIAGLVRSIYEAMGSSLEHQPSGGKTIKVRLTVSPETIKTETIKSDENDIVDKKPITNIGDGCVNPEDRDPTVEGGAEVPTYVEGEHCIGRLKLESQSTYEHPRVPLGPHPTTKLGLASQNRRKSLPKASDGISLIQKRRLLDMIHANLEKSNFGCVQEPARKRLSECSDDKRRHRHHHHPHQHQQHQEQEQRHLQNNYFRSRDVECRERRNHYLDLAGIENYSLKLEGDRIHAPCRTKGVKHDEYEGEVEADCIRCSFHGLKTDVHQLRNVCGNHHMRSRSHDTAAADDLFQQRPSFPYHYLSEDSGDGELAEFAKRLNEKTYWLRNADCGPSHDLHSALYHSRSKSYDAYCYDPIFASRKDKLMELSKGGNMNFINRSPHHRKHRHREREYQRSMQQVASWLEREHIGGACAGHINMATAGSAQSRNDHCHNHRHRHQRRTTKTQQEQERQPTPPDNANIPDRSPLVVERHEHHHIHEHFHHHYHHYHEL